MATCNSSRHFFSLTSFQVGDLQSYLSDLTLFLAPDCKTFYVLVDNRPWLENLVSRPAHLWQLMVTKSRMSPFAITRTQRGRKDAQESNESENLRRWFSLIDATVSRKRALLPVKKLKVSLLANSKLHRTLYGFIVFKVAWKDVRGINYLNELQTDTSLAIEAKYMRRWEFDSITQAAKDMNSWFPGTLRERILLEVQLNSMLGEVFHDAPNCHSTDDDNDDGDDGSNKRRELFNFLEAEFDAEETHSESDCEEVDEATEYKDVLLLFRFKNHDLPFELQNIIMSDLRLLTLLEAGLPSWVIFFQSYPLFCHIYRPWMCPLARVLYVVVSVVTVVIGFYDLYKNIPLLKATAARLCGPLFGWIETWEMVSRIKYLGTILFLHNFEKAVKWFLMMTGTIQSFLSVLTQPLRQPFMVVLDVLFPIWNMYIQIVEYICSVIWILMTTLWNIVENLIRFIIFPVYFISSVIWVIGKVKIYLILFYLFLYNVAWFEFYHERVSARAILYPVFWLLWGILYAPICIIITLSNLVGFIFNYMFDFIGGIWHFVSGLFKLASNAETNVGTYEVSMWRTLWNDLFSQIFRAVRSILNGFVAFFTACNRHRLSIYNHLQEFIRRLNQQAQRSNLLNSIQRAKKSGSKTLAEDTEQRKGLLTKYI